MNSTVELLLQHRSIRKFEDRPVPDETLRVLVQCGQAAATSSNVQAVTAIHVTKPEARAELAALAGGQRYVTTAGAFLVYCADLRRPMNACVSQGGQFSEGMMEHFLIASIDVALAAQNTVVAAESLGLGICYIGGLRNNPVEVSKLLELPQQVYPVFGLCLGYPDQDPDVKPRLPVDAVLMKDVYDESSQEQLLNQYDDQVRHYYKTRTGGKKDSSWSEEMKALVGKESRPHMKSFLASQGFAIK